MRRPQVEQEQCQKRIAGLASLSRPEIWPDNAEAARFRAK